jgi:hypothetical protein
VREKVRSVERVLSTDPEKPTIVAQKKVCSSARSPAAAFVARKKVRDTGARFKAFLIVDAFEGLPGRTGDVANLRVRANLSDAYMQPTPGRFSPTVYRQCAAAGAQNFARK